MLEKDKIIIRQYNLSLRDSIINCVPTLFGATIFFLVLLLGIKHIKIEFADSNFYELIMIVWLIMTMHFTRIVPAPRITWHVKETEE